MIEEKKEHKFEGFESKLSDSKSISSKSINFEDFRVEMATLHKRNVAYLELKTQPFSITYLALNRPLKLNSGFFNLLSKFSGWPGEDPYHHINEIIIRCSTMLPMAITRD